MQQGPTSNAVFSGHQMAVKIFGCVETPVHTVHLPVEHIAGAIGRGILIRLRIGRGAVT